MGASTAGSGGQIVVVGAGYAGLHVALRLTARLRDHPAMELTLVDRHDYHQVITELPRVVGGTRAADAVRIPLQDLLAERVRFVQTEITGGWGIEQPGTEALGPSRELAIRMGARWPPPPGRATSRSITTSTTRSAPRPDASESAMVIIQEGKTAWTIR